MGKKSSSLKSKPSPATSPPDRTSGKHKIDDVTITLDAKAANRSLGLVDNGLEKKASATGGLRQVNPVEAGRYDLIPGECLVAVDEVLDTATTLFDGESHMYQYMAGNRDQDHLAILASTALLACGNFREGLRRLAVHYARGAVKYADRNWEKGLETGRLVDSLVRHLGKAMRGDTDEDHLAAVVWNAFALMWHENRIEDGRLPKELDTYGVCR